MVSSISKVTPPSSEVELMQRAKGLAGLSIAQIAGDHQFQVPETLHRDKGWIGQLLEKALGATAASLAEPDFQTLGIELKTIPINQQGMPSESTYICVTPLLEIQQQVWRTSNVWRKLARVLWIPIEAETAEDYQKFQSLRFEAMKLINEREQLKISFTLSSNNAERKSIKDQINIIDTNINNFEEDARKLYVPIFVIKDPIKWLDKDPSFQIKFPTEIKKLLPIIDNITKNTIERSDSNREQLALSHFHTLLNAYLTNEDRKRCYSDYYNHRKLAVIQILYMRIRQLEPGTKDINFFISAQNKKGKDGDLKALYHLAKLILADATDNWHRHLKSSVSNKKLSKVGKAYLKHILDNIPSSDKNVKRNLR